VTSWATAFLGRDHYRRGARERVDWRNGYAPTQVQREAGLLELAVPPLRGTEEPFQPRVTGRLRTRTGDLETGIHLAGCQHLLARSARLGPLCGSQREQNSRNEPHSGPK